MIRHVMLWFYLKIKIIFGCLFYNDKRRPLPKKQMVFLLIFIGFFFFLLLRTNERMKQSMMQKKKKNTFSWCTHWYVLKPQN